MGYVLSSCRFKMRRRPQVGMVHTYMFFCEFLWISYISGKINGWMLFGVSCLGCEAHSSTNCSFILNLDTHWYAKNWTAFLTPDSDNWNWQKLLLLKPCLLDMGHSYDIDDSISYFVWEVYSNPLLHCCHWAMVSNKLNWGVRVIVVGKPVGLWDQPWIGKCHSSQDITDITIVFIVLEINTIVSPILRVLFYFFLLFWLCKLSHPSQSLILSFQH